MNKSLLTLIIIALLPFGANAAYTYNYVDNPAPVANNGTVTLSHMIDEKSGYQTASISNDDYEHIASTAYVKGAYNDVIAGLNSKQGVVLNIANNARIKPVALDSGDFLDVISDIETPSTLDSAEHVFVTAGAVASGIRSQQVKIYTTWEDDSDSATTHVLLDTVLPDDD